MPYKKHDRVYHQKLKKDGVVVDVLKTGLLKVALGNVIVECREADLISMRKGVGGAPPIPSIKSRAAVPSRKMKRPPASTKCDLHGMRVEEALRVVEAKVNEALLAEIDSVEIIHGVGTGALRYAVHGYLKGLSVVKHFKIDEHNPGTTWVYF